MINFLEIVLILIIVAMGVVVLYFLKKKVESEKEAGLLEKEKNEYAELGKGLAEYNQKLQEKKEKIKTKILELLQKSSKITNREVASKLGVARVSAFRYLDELEKEGKLKQVGKTGMNVVYTLNTK